MKTAWVAGAIFFAIAICAFGDSITVWNFNSVPPDTNTTTGSLAPSIGTGTATNIGLVSSAFATGGGADPASTDDTAWRTGNYPAQGFGNKTGGVQFNVSTAGYSNIVIRWDQMISSTASKYYRLQYATNGVSFYDYPTPITMNDFKGFEAQTNGLAAFPSVNNNPSFAFRIVSEWESTAIGTGFTGYAPPFSTNSYNQSSGAVRFDYVLISGTVISDGNTPPVISGPTNQTVRVNQSTGPLPFTVLDAEDPATNLMVYGFSSDPTIVPATNILFGGSSSARTVAVTAAGQAGSASITVWVADSGGKSNSASFNLTVLPANTSPVISTIPRTNTLMNEAAGPIPFTIGDAETSANNLTMSAFSANSTLLPGGNILLAGTGSYRTVTVSPAPSQIGVAPITLAVSDGTNTAAASFALMVLPSSSFLFYDPFNYATGSLLTNSGFLWDSRSGTLGQCQVTNGQLLIAGAQGEDVDAPLVGAPFHTGSNTTLYAAFKATFLTLPKDKPDYFAHFTGGSTFRARLYAGVPTNATAGFFRLQVANNTNAAELAVDLTTNIAYTVVLRYPVDTPATTLWVNPVTEASPGATASDPASTLSITAFDFRQDAGVGADLLIDDFKVGLSFAAVTSTNAASLSPIPLQFQRVGSNLILKWSNPAFALQSSPAPTGSFTNLPSSTSPFTNPLSGPPRFFRLKGN
jgi:hypothetical protein